jgi:rhodanese-related sulfurtransferase
MRKLSLIVPLFLALAVSLAVPATSGQWADPALVAAAEKLLATMPADFYAGEPAAVQQQLENARPFVLDVRETKELAAGKIAESVNIPIRELPKQLGKLPESKSAPIVTYCKVGYRGGMAVTVLRMWGYTNVRTIKGGLDAWEKAGLPVVDKVS